jgi:hypothetical protein
VKKISVTVLVLAVLSTAVVADAGGRTKITGYGQYTFGMSQATVKSDPGFRFSNTYQQGSLTVSMFEKTVDEKIDLGGTARPVPATIRLGFVQGHLVIVHMTLHGPMQYSGAPGLDLYESVRAQVLDAYDPALVTGDTRPGSFVATHMGVLSVDLADSDGNKIMVLQNPVLSKTDVTVMYESGSLAHASNGF